MYIVRDTLIEKIYVLASCRVMRDVQITPHGSQIRCSGGRLVGHQPLTSAARFDSRLGIWSWRRKWEGPFMSCLNYAQSLGGDVKSLTYSPNPIWGILKNPQHFSKRVRESPRYWIVGLSYMLDALITWIPAAEDVVVIIIIIIIIIIIRLCPIDRWRKT